MSNVIITGSTGMVGKGVLLECLDHENIDQVIIVNRNSLGMQHPKLKEILLKDFMEAATISDQLTGCDACFFCMGVSAIGMSEEAYSKITYDMTKAFVDTVYALNPNSVFNYVSGVGTDSTEKGRSMWARVKGKTENMILNKGFKDAYAFRPGVIIPEKGIKSSTGWYQSMYVITRPIHSFLKGFKSVTTTTKVGLAMINSLYHPVDKKVLEPLDINKLSGK